MITITSKKDGFYRAGVRHSAAPTKYADDRFTPEQLKKLKAEPMLVVVEEPGKPVPGGGAKEVKQDPLIEEVAWLKIKVGELSDALDMAGAGLKALRVEIDALKGAGAPKARKG